MIGTALIVVGFTAGVAISGRILFVNGVRVGEERAPRTAKHYIKIHAHGQRQWYKNAPDLEKIDVRRTEFEAKLEGIKEVTELI